MSNHPHRRRRARRRNEQPRIRWAAFIDPTDIPSRLDACGCPAIIATTPELITVEHYHRTGCPRLEHPPDPDD